MTRDSFLLMLLAAVPLTSLAGSSWRPQKPAAGFKAKAGEGRYNGHIQLKGVNANILDVKVSGRDTDGALAIFEQTSVSPGKGTPLHLHHDQDEIFYVLEGQYAFQVGEQKHDLAQGDTIFLPRKIPHAWAQVSERGRMMVTLQPAGQLENFFLAMAALETEPSKEQIAQIFAAHGMQVVGPPLQVGKGAAEK
ncbi:cupin domain-containing protein [Pontibacter mangrovi]|uniref:Cupin domain-containing protein n=1 Tax=Pontibacter mangrovi TaxID=2589816 RepID=A0A501W4B4_9BACT|nr:cupin domain-containing protein [Pontibacter mangrovi]TPE43485.1 cupin domain-containing protein [Pontibacter mangrovi]